MRRPFHVHRFNRSGPLVGRSWWETDLANLTDDEIYARSVADPHRQGGYPTPEGERVLAYAASIGVNVGALWRAVYSQWSEHDGFTRPFDECSWPQAIAYSSLTLGIDAPEAARHEWAIRYMWCLELPKSQHCRAPAEVITQETAP